MNKKRILIFSLAYFPKHVGGAEVAIKEITDRIADIEFHAVVLRFDRTLARHEKIGNVRVHRIGFTRVDPSMGDLRKFPLHLNKFIYQFFAPIYALYLHRVYRFDAAWGMMAHSCGVPVTLFNWLTKVPYVLTLQEGDPIPYIMHKVRHVKPLFIRAFKKAAIIQPISQFLARWAVDMGYTGPIEVIPNAVDTKHFSAPVDDAVLKELRAGFPGGADAKYVITTSRLVPKNAVDIVISAMKYLPQQIHFLVLGIGPDEMVLNALAKSEGVSDRVHFLGTKNHKELPMYLQASDVFIRPSRSEGMGNSFVEAMAAGIPVIATREGGIPDFLFDPEQNPDKPSTGLFVRTEDPKDTAEKITRFLDDQQFRETCVENARALVFALYDWGLIAGNMEKKVFARLFRDKSV